jgi:hypothetical protein
VYGFADGRSPESSRRLQIAWLKDHFSKLSP